MRKYILVVDDSLTIRVSVGYVLKQAGYEVTLAIDGIDAMEKLKTMAQAGQDISMIITDVNMPRMDGITFTEKVKQSSFRRKPVLILTTETHEARKQQGCTAGVAGWIVKPFQPEQQITMVEKLTN